MPVFSGAGRVPRINPMEVSESKKLIANMS
jgi:hypothetical protein